MKKLLMGLFVLVASLVLVACNKTEEPTKEETPAAVEAEYKLGMAVVASIGHANEATDIQVDSTVAAVVLDKDGKIVACRIDALQNIATVTDGALTSKNTTSKADLKEDYHMAQFGASLDPNGDGVVKEWYLQAQAFEAHVVGMTGAQVAAMTTAPNFLGYQMSTDEALLAAGCTIQITDFIQVVSKACEDTQATTFKTAKEFTLGVAVTGELNAKDSKNATATEPGTAALYSEYACSVVVDGKIAATLNDAIQPKLAFNADATLPKNSLTYTATKRELKEGYMMAQLGATLDPNGDGVVKEWYLQSAAFSAHVIGMTGAQVAAMTTAPNFLNYQMSTDEALLAAGCTIQISTIKVVVANSVANAR